MDILPTPLPTQDIDVTWSLADVTALARGEPGPTRRAPAERLKGGRSPREE